MATYHDNRRIKWDDSGTAYHDNGRIAFSSGTAYHYNGRIAYFSGTAYHDNGRIAFFSGTFYESNGRIVKKASFSISLGKGVALHIIPSIKITVYDRKIS